MYGQVIDMRLGMLILNECLRILARMKGMQFFKCSVPNIIPLTHYNLSDFFSVM